MSDKDHLWALWAGENLIRILTRTLVMIVVCKQVALCGFGNLPGDIEFWDRKKGADGERSFRHFLLNFCSTSGPFLLSSVSLHFFREESLHFGKVWVYFGKDCLLLARRSGRLTSARWFCSRRSFWADFPVAKMGQAASVSPRVSRTSHLRCL